MKWYSRWQWNVWSDTKLEDGTNEVVVKSKDVESLRLASNEKIGKGIILMDKVVYKDPWKHYKLKAHCFLLWRFLKWLKTTEITYSSKFPFRSISLCGGEIPPHFKAEEIHKTNKMNSVNNSFGILKQLAENSDKWGSAIIQTRSCEWLCCCWWAESF